MFNFTEFYKKYSVDLNKLKRDYEKNPLQKILTEIYNKKTGKLHNKRYIKEKPYKEDIEYLYIELNIPLKDILSYFNLKAFKFGQIRREYNIKKTASEHIKNTKEYFITNYGVISPSSLSEIKDKIKKTNLERYGVTSPLKSKEIQNKVKETNLERYGVENPLQSDEIRNKVKETNLKRYGVENSFASKEIQNKIKQTNLERYGVENPSQSDEIKEKKKQTTLIHYGVENPSQSDEIIRKIFRIRKNNKTLNTSKKEDQIYRLLKIKFLQVERQYKSEKYPFACDFYIPELELYIEYQGHLSHGKEPFDNKNKKHLEILNIWNNRAKIKHIEGKKVSQYDSYIDVWTRRDPLKRKVARENELNWIEFFTFKDFMNWYNNLIKGDINE